MTRSPFTWHLFARVYGTNNVNNCSYYCHQASGVGLTSVIGTGAGTVTLEDIERSDLLFVIGANPASNHPRLMRAMVDLRRRGGKVIVINPLREPGLVKFKVPSDVRSMLWASTIADAYLQPHVGGDIALMAGIAKCIMERGQQDENFVRSSCEDWEAFRHSIATTPWPEIVRKSGVERRAIRSAAEMYAASRNAIFSWAMGITHHAHGVDNVRMIANLAMTRGMLGAPGRGLLPLRGHSNVQGVGSMGVVPKLKPEIAQRMQEAFGITLPRKPGVDTLEGLSRAREGKIHFASCMGGNLYGASPDANFAAEAFAKIGLVTYFSTALNTGHAWGRGRETLILPVLARDEESQSTTQESMFSYVRLSDGGESRHEGPRSEVDLVASIAEAFYDGEASPIDWRSLRNHGAVRKKIAEVIPGYEPIGSIDETRQEFHIPGRRFPKPQFATKTGRAKFHVIQMPPLIGVDGDGHVNGKFSTLRLMTMRSEGQFNTVVYEEEDIYRGQERRDVILMNRDDARRMGLPQDSLVTVRSSEERTLANVVVRHFDIPPGNAAMYYPEANVLVPQTADGESRTPSFKSFPVQIEPQPNGKIAPKREALVTPTASASDRKGKLKAC